MFLAVRDNKGLPGTYVPCHCGPGGTLSATLVCPTCASKIALKTHRIEHNGHVQGVVACQHPLCDWEELVDLVGWQPIVEALEASRGRA